MLEERKIFLDGREIVYYVKRKKIKNMYMRFQDGKIVISTSKSCSVNLIEKFISSKKDWVFDQFEKEALLEDKKEDDVLKNGSIVYYLGVQYRVRLIPSDRNFVGVDDEFVYVHVKSGYVDRDDYVLKVYEEWLKSECLKVCREYVDLYVPRMKEFDVPYPEIGVKKVRSRWGCCIPKKRRVEFSMNLVKADLKCIEYVVVHELAHFKVINHDKRFYGLVSLFVPDWKMRREILNKDYGKLIA